jgi:hypothetical protein
LLAQKKLKSFQTIKNPLERPLAGYCKAPKGFAGSKVDVFERSERIAKAD